MALFSRKPKPAAPAPAAATTPTTPATSNDAREARIFEIGSDFLARARGHKTSLLSAKFYSDWLMEWSMKDPNFKVQMFRFTDAFPDAQETPRRDLRPPARLPQPTRRDAAARLQPGHEPRRTRQGTHGQDDLRADHRHGREVHRRHRRGQRRPRPSLKGSGTTASPSASTCLARRASATPRPTAYAPSTSTSSTTCRRRPSPREWPGPTRASRRDHLGAIPRTNVSIKISSLSSRVDPIDTEGSIRDLMERPRPDPRGRPKAKGVFVNFDMEHHELKDFTLELFMRCVETAWTSRPASRCRPTCSAAEQDARRIMRLGRPHRSRSRTVRLVKGAYWDSETINAEQQGWPCPVWSRKKSQTDACFEHMAEIFLDRCHAPRPRAA